MGLANRGADSLQSVVANNQMQNWPTPLDFTITAHPASAAETMSLDTLSLELLKL